MAGEACRAGGREWGSVPYCRSERSLYLWETVEVRRVESTGGVSAGHC